MNLNQQQQNVGFQLPVPQQEVPAMPHQMHRVQNVARENLNQHSNNYENQAQMYNSDDVRRSNGPQNRRKRANDYGRRNRNTMNGQPVPMVTTSRQNKRPRKENRKGTNKPREEPKDMDTVRNKIRLKPFMPVSLNISVN